MQTYYKAYGNYDEFCQKTACLPFAEYISYCQDFIKRIRQNAGLTATIETIAMNSPFEIRPENFNGENAILLVHGYLASPYMMRALGQFFAAQGFLVRAILLPGHGSSPGELCNAKLKHWQSAVNYGLESLQPEAKKIHLAGYSLGATLASLAAFRHAIASIIMLSPAHAITPLAHLLPLFARIKQYTGIAILPWLLQQSQDDLVTYRSYPSISVMEVHKAVKLLQNELAKQNLNIPCFIALTFDDGTINPKETLSFFKKHHNAKSRMLLYSKCAQQIGDNRILVIASGQLEKQVRELSHISMPIAPDDPYYGKNGQYYGSLTEDITFGETNLLNRFNKKFRRLSYHPGFLPMLNALREFLNSLS